MKAGVSFLRNVLGSVRGSVGRPRRWDGRGRVFGGWSWRVACAVRRATSAAKKREQMWANRNSFCTLLSSTAAEDRDPRPALLWHHKEMLSSLPAPTRPAQASPPPGDGGVGGGGGPSSSTAPPKEPPGYGCRAGFVPRTQADFGDGGALNGEKWMIQFCDAAVVTTGGGGGRGVKRHAGGTAAAGGRAPASEFGAVPPDARLSRHTPVPHGATASGG